MVTMPDGPLNYSTKIPARRTAAECVDLLAEAGAQAVAVQYADKQPVGISFTLATPYGLRDFAMPVNIDGVHALLIKLNKAGKLPRTAGRSTAIYDRHDHAGAVAWRQIRMWLDAQLAIIEAGMVTLDEVMIPYLMVAPGVTIRDRWLDGGFAAIEGPKP